MLTRVPTIPAWSRLTICGVLTLAASAWPAYAAETCHYAGTTDYDGQVAVTTTVEPTKDGTRVDVALTFDSVTMILFHVRYLIEEISFWRGSTLQSVAMNTRYLFSEHIVRQQWDVFRRAPDGLQGFRGQAKTLADFELKHPGFVRHWDPVTFAQPWTGDYQAAPPERRADLDLKGLPANLRSPLAMAFYWTRFLPKDGQDVAVFLPGFKKDRLAELPIRGTPSSGGMSWQAPLRYPLLSPSPVSIGSAQTSADGHLLRLAFMLHQPRGSAQGEVHQQGCDGAPVPPDRDR